MSARPELRLAAVRQHALDHPDVDRGDQAALALAQLGALLLAGEVVAMAGVVAHDLARASEAEALCGAAPGLELRRHDGNSLRSAAGEFLRPDASFGLIVEADAARNHGTRAARRDQGRGAIMN